jgi:hypothetical protein
LPPRRRERRCHADLGALCFGCHADLGALARSPDADLGAKRTDDLVMRAGREGYADVGALFLTGIVDKACGKPQLFTLIQGRRHAEVGALQR